MILSVYILQIVGWGLNEHDEPSSVLKEANLPYIDRDECKRINSYGFRVYLTKERFCAGSLARNRNYDYSIIY